MVGSNHQTALGIRPVIDGRRGGVRESLESQTLALSPPAAGPGDALGEKHFTRKHGASAYYGQPGKGGRGS